MTNKSKTIFSALRAGVLGVSLMAAAVSTPAMAALTSAEQAQSAALKVALLNAVCSAEAEATAKHLTGDAFTSAIEIAIVAVLQGDATASPAVRLAALQAAQIEPVTPCGFDPAARAALALVARTIAPVTPTALNGAANAPGVVGAPPAAGGATGGSDYRVP
jgi:hypothetical protein